MSVYMTSDAEEQTMQAHVNRLVILKFLETNRRFSDIEMYTSFSSLRKYLHSQKPDMYDLHFAGCSFPDVVNGLVELSFIKKIDQIDYTITSYGRNILKSNNDFLAKYFEKTYSVSSPSSLDELIRKHSIRIKPLKKAFSLRMAIF